MNRWVDLFSSLPTAEGRSLPAEMIRELREAFDVVRDQGGDAKDLRAAADRVWSKWGRSNG